MNVEQEYGLRNFSLVYETVLRFLSKLAENSAGWAIPLSCHLVINKN
jgi:hypothetical protein